LSSVELIPSPELVLKRRLEKVAADPEKHWLDRLDANSRKAARICFRRWFRWLHTRSGYETISPREIVVRRITSPDDYEFVDLMQEFIGSLVMRKASKGKFKWAVESFFMHNRAELPRDGSFKIRGDRPPVEGKLTAQDVRDAYLAASPYFKSIIIFKWQTFLDNARIIYANEHCADQIVQQMQEGRDPVRLDIPGRKENENETEGRYYTYFTKDTIDALTYYFEEQRGWPKKGEPIWIQCNHKTLYSPTMEANWLRLNRRIGKVPRRKGPLGTRYGYNMHEMRDAAMSYLFVNAKQKGLEMDCVKFWSGRVGEIDPQRYLKFYQDTKFVERQYTIAGPYLNIISNPSAAEQADKLAKKNLELSDELTKLKDTVDEIKAGRGFSEQDVKRMVENYLAKR